MTAEAPARWLDSWNLSAAFGAKYYTGAHGNLFVGLEARLEESFHDTDGGSELSGSALNVRLMFGWSGDRWRNRRLTALRAERWD